MLRAPIFSKCSVFLSLTLLLVAGCAGQPGGNSVPAVEECAGANYYIPADTFPRKYPGADVKRRAWYSSVLYRSAEPSLSCGEDVGESYRLIWLHSLAQPVVIRITRSGEGAALNATQLSGYGFTDPGFISYRATKELSAAEWAQLKKALIAASFETARTSSNLYGVHGSQWIVEGRDENGTYHIVDRWSPQGGAFRDLGTLFFDLAGWARPLSTQY